MIITKTRTMRFNMGSYEHLELTATVQVDTAELNPGADGALVANQVLDELLQDDIDRADSSSQTPQDETYLHAWKDNI